jgi:hypothetical protein
MRQIQQAVAGQLMQHVIEKGHAGGHRTLAAAIEIEQHAHLCFAGDPVDFTSAHGAKGGRSRTPSWRAARLGQSVRPPGKPPGKPNLSSATGILQGAAIGPEGRIGAE